MKLKIRKQQKKTKTGVLKKFNKIDTPLVRLQKSKEDITTNVKNEVGNITTDPTAIKKEIK